MLKNHLNIIDYYGQSKHLLWKNQIFKKEKNLELWKVFKSVT
jgi:hypothetical protein